MPLFLRFNNYIEFLIQSLQIVRNMQNSIECFHMTAAMLVSQTNPLGVELFSYVKRFLLLQ